MYEAVILAGGLGTRLARIVKDTQKVMAPIAGRPFLQYVLDDLIDKGFSRFALAVSYKQEQIRGFFGSSYKGSEIIYSVEKEPLGTGGAIKRALSFIKSPYCAVVNGDTFFDVDYTALESCHLKNKADITLSAKEMFSFSRYGTIDINDDKKVLSFNEKKETARGYINGGIYIADKAVFERIEKSEFSFEKDVLEKSGTVIYAEIFSGFFIDIGVPDDYFSAGLSLPAHFGATSFKAVFLDYDSVICCKEKNHLYKCGDFEFIEGVPYALARLREAGYLLIVAANRAGVAKGLHIEKDVDILSRYLNEKLKDITRLDAVYYCPCHDNGSLKGYAEYPDCQKTNDLMIRKAVLDFRKKGINIDLSASIIVGNKESDILADRKSVV